MEARRVPLFDMRSEIAGTRTETTAAIERVLDSGVFIGGEEVEAFETELARAVGAARAVGVSSGTDALLATFMALGVRPGDEVITTPLTFISTASSAARLGARIVFADVAPDTLDLDPVAALAACSPRTKAIVTVNLYGRLAPIPDAPCPVIEDSAHTLSPPRGIAATFSFFPTKNLGAFGDAGAIVTNDATFADRVTLLRSHGARPKYHHVELGGNFRLDALQAAILRAKLPSLATQTATRREHASRYRSMFATAHTPAELVLPIEVPSHAYHQYVIRAPRRDELRAFLAANGVGTEVYYPLPLHRQPIFESLGFGAGSFPHAERACHEVLALPIYPSLQIIDQQYVVDQIAAFYAR
jgi:dTDP-4-amino-4,6-dideoxygalactose transaminase